MATPAEVQAQLGAGERDPRILQSAHSTDTLKEHYYVLAGPAAAGRARWIDCTASDSAATQAAAIVAALAA
jgi:hypothetical protein